MKNVREILNGKSLLVLLVVLIAYGQTLLMYFWQDDSALIFKLQNPEGLAGSFGYGVVGTGAYKWLVTPFVPFYPIFGKDPTGYFLVGFLTYLLATYFFYRFVRVLFDEKKYSYYASLIFAAGYIGSDIMFRVINSWQTNIGLVLAFLTFEQLAKFTRTKRVIHYIFAVLFYWSATEFVFIRSHSLIVPIVILDALFLVEYNKLSSFLKYATRQIPFLVIFYIRYLTDEGFGGPGIMSLAKELFAGKIEVLAPFIANIGNSVVAYPLQKIILSFFSKSSASEEPFIVSSIAVGMFSVLYLVVMRNTATKMKAIGLGSLLMGLLVNIYLYTRDFIWYRDIATIFSGALGLEFVIFAVIISIQNRYLNKTISKIAFFSLVFVMTQVFGYFVQYPSAIWETTHRYYSYVLIGFAIFIASFIKLLETQKGMKNMGKASLIGLLSLHLYLGFNYQAHLVENRSKTSREFYSRLLTYVPQIEKGSGFYFDVSSVAPFPQRFSDFFSVGSMPESTALAMYYEVDRYDLQYLTDFDETAAIIANDELDIDKLYAFYYGGNGLQDNTTMMRELLRNGSKTSTYSSFSEVSTNSLLPIELTFTMSATKGEVPHEFASSGFSFDEKLSILKYLVDRNEYYEKVSAESTSDWRFREVRNAVDKDFTSPWQGHRIHWNTNEHEELMVDLGEIKNVGSVVWTNWNTSLAPVDYSIETSIDRNIWSVQKVVTDGPERKDAEQVVEEFKSVDARYVRMVITKTQTNDSPSLLEFEVVESAYANVPIIEAQTYYDHPLSLASNEDEWMRLYDWGRPLSFSIINWQTDKNGKTIQGTRVPIVVDGNSRMYKVYLPAGGTLLNGMTIDYSIPVNSDIQSISIRNLSITDLIDNGLIVDYTVN